MMKTSMYLTLKVVIIIRPVKDNNSTAVKRNPFHKIAWNPEELNKLKESANDTLEFEQRSQNFYFGPELERGRHFIFHFSFFIFHFSFFIFHFSFFIFHFSFFIF